MVTYAQKPRCKALPGIVLSLSLSRSLFSLFSLSLALALALALSLSLALALALSLLSLSLTHSLSLSRALSLVSSLCLRDHAYLCGPCSGQHNRRLVFGNTSNTQLCVHMRVCTWKYAYRTAPLPMPGYKRVFREDANHARNFEGSYVTDVRDMFSALAPLLPLPRAAPRTSPPFPRAACLPPRSTTE